MGFTVSLPSLPSFAGARERPPSTTHGGPAASIEGPPKPVDDSGAAITIVAPRAVINREIACSISVSRFSIAHCAEGIAVMVCRHPSCSSRISSSDSSTSSR
jgi:hypothetical protein